MTTLRKAGICNKPTHRGCSGGSHSDLGHHNSTVHLQITGGGSNFDDLPLQQPIPVVTSLPVRTTASITHGMSQDNLKPIEHKARVRAGGLNCQSIENKTASIIDHLISPNLEVLALTETWLNASDSNKRKIGELIPPSFSFHHVPMAGRGVGVAILCRNTFNVKVLPIFHATSFESLDVCITAESVVIRMIVIYRIPPNSKNGIQKICISLRVF